MSVASPPPAPPKQESLVEKFVRQGYITIENALPPDLLEEVHTEYYKALADKVRRFGVETVQVERKDGKERVLNEFVPVGGNHDTNRWNMHLPSRRPFLDERIFAHPQVLEVVDELMGSEAVCYLIASDTAYPGSTPQSVHQDFARFSIAANIPLVDFTPDNGPIGLWPGTHLPEMGHPDSFTKDPYFITKEKMERILETVEEMPAIIPAGTILLRDHRMVHRGTSNRTDTPRAMLSVYYVPAHEEVPHRWLADLGARNALTIRKIARGGGSQVQRPKLLNLGNLLGRVVEESSLSDRDHRRVIPEDIWNDLSPRAKHLLRYARHEGGERVGTASAKGSLNLIRAWTGSSWDFVRSAMKGEPRKPDQSAA